jgi:hypothetical protein
MDFFNLKKWYYQKELPRCAFAATEGPSWLVFTLQQVWETDKILWPKQSLGPTGCWSGGFNG